MKGRVLTVTLLTIVGFVLLLNGQPAQAGANPLLVLDNVFAAINTGDVDLALASFSEDATGENLVRGETYVGQDEIRQMLKSMHREGRRLDIVETGMDGEQIVLKVEVSDQGRVWGTETIAIQLKDGKLYSFTVTAFRLELWRIGR